MVHSLRT
jgi:hypothetical protein